MGPKKEKEKYIYEEEGKAKTTKIWIGPTQILNTDSFSCFSHTLEIPISHFSPNLYIFIMYENYAYIYENVFSEDETCLKVKILVSIGCFNSLRFVVMVI